MRGRAGPGRGRVAVSGSEPGTDCPPPDPNPNPQARPPPVLGPGPSLGSPGVAALARRRAEREAARWLQRHFYLPFPSRTPTPNLDRGFNGGLGRGGRDTPLPAETRAAWRPQQFQPNPNLPSRFRVPNPNPDLESHGSEHRPLRPDLGRGLRPSPPGVLPGFGDGKLADRRKTLLIWEITLKHDSRVMINEAETRRRELRHFADQILQFSLRHTKNLPSGLVYWYILL
ncbi:hypothetical protein OPV22_029376 [Ensete ventricosum]|uniref:Uncharacterized protein n=1 Tax=Ensete ventricosum TaxID=4639 RepID=A0AAV8QDD0_ENSVE|nr:hypothetical protein OPV22_029376 [Ensete ventricosum]